MPLDEVTIEQAFPPPAGAQRVDGGAFGAWILAHHVLAPEVPVTTHTGEVVHHEARVIQMGLVPGDLQQCADSAIRLRAEWEQSIGVVPMFHMTNGDPMLYGGGDWDKYLIKVFSYASTRSLGYDSDEVEDPLPGDMIVRPGSPGHAVVLLDVAKKDGVTYALVGEGYMPAQTFHVELGPYDGWWQLDGAVLSPHWGILDNGTLRRWKAERPATKAH